MNTEHYKRKHEELMQKLQTFQQFEKSDKVVALVLDIARRIVANPKDSQNVSWLVENGSLLSGYYAYLEGKSAEARAEAETAEIAYRSVRDGIMISLRRQDAGMTEARAEANRDSMEAEVDVKAKEQRAAYYATAAKACDRMVSFIQTTIRQKQYEQSKVGTAERGNYPTES